ncbi:MAG: hypothetical protein LBO78_02010 [Rickettsiales bacterium]|jgi:hypothetical protein|nr:hypothetical protein [Rickettsiales bacterium]
MPHHANSTSFKKGHAFSRGRPPGSRNKMTKAVKNILDMTGIQDDLLSDVLTVYQSVGGKMLLDRLANEDPKYLTRLIMEITSKRLASKDNAPASPVFNMNFFRDGKVPVKERDGK